MEELKVKIKDKFTRESEFTTLWIKELKELGFVADKISDGSIGMKKIDCYITSDISMYACEVKIIEGDTFNLGKIRDNQWTYLSQINKLGQKAILCVASKKNQKYVIFDFDRIKDYDRKTTSLQLNFI